MSEADDICLLLKEKAKKQLLHLQKRSEASPELFREYGALVCLNPEKDEVKLREVIGKPHTVTVDIRKCKENEIPIGIVHTHSSSLLIDKHTKKALYAIGDFELPKEDLKAAKAVGFNCALNRIQKDILITCADYHIRKRQDCTAVVQQNIPINKKLVERAIKKITEETK